MGGGGSSMDGRPNSGKKSCLFEFLRFKERFRKAPFRDGLMWTIGLTVEIKLPFQIPPV